MRGSVSAVLTLLLLAPLTAWAHAGHGLADGHEWFHALLPFAGALLLIMARPLFESALTKVRTYTRRR